MAIEPNIVQVAAAVGDATRACMLTALMSGQALTATELADVAGVTRQTASVHLAKLLEAGLLRQVAQGRHRYFQLAGIEVGQLIESIMGLANQTRQSSLGTRNPALRKARVCYDHLAGDLGVLVFDGLLTHHALQFNDEQLSLGVNGMAFFQTIGIDIQTLKTNRPTCLACLDWSARRPHLAGALGAAFLSHCLALNWCQKDTYSRILHFSTDGEKKLREMLSF